ncbi:MAG: tRNA (adenosine(37)-N6)-dimethylallyltransferase MiaA [Candidatus Latescibacteria bacterium]|nr:tRNA (adenosine(37)-N6)-dimethylallyltransferase MiaA [Candidatus Latescibacterota bacterium]
MLRKLIIITGPTGVGKTALGIEIALELGGEIISADSRQLYRYMDIGTAKPSRLEQARVKHHCLDLIEPGERYSAGQFAQHARALIENMWNRRIVPVIVGGTGLYIQALLDGLWEEEQPVGAVRAGLLHRLETAGLGELYEELGRVDPIAQARLAEGDTQRVLRALELALSTGSKGGIGADPLACTPLAFCLCRDRDHLYHRIGQRVDEMVQKGLVAEVKDLLSKGYNRSTYALQSMGYEEVLDTLEAKCTWEEAIAKIKLNSRQYAKRQLTWFRKDRRFRWINLDTWGVEGGRERVVGQFRNRIGF